MPMTIMPEWLLDFANMHLPDWLYTIAFAWFPDNNIIPFLFLSFMLKCFLISFYCAMIYLGTRLIRRLRGPRMRIRTGYYSWYALLFSVPLSGLAFNNAIKLPFYDVFLGGFTMEFPELNAITDQELHAILNLTRMARIWQPILFYLTAIWLLVIILKCLRQIVLNIKLQQQIKRQVSFADPNNLKQKAAHEFGLRADKIHIIAADFIRSPVSYGIFKKTILLPRDYAERYTSSELYLLLLHEMGHIKNHDTLKIQLLSIAECFIWVLRPMRKGFIRDSEILCDNRVLGIQKDSLDAYGEMIIRECSEKHLVKGLGFSDSFHTIKARVESIYSHRPEKHHIAAFAIAIALLLASYTVYASQVPTGWLTTNPMANEIDDLRVYYIDKESGEEYSESLFSLAQSPSPDGELIRYSNGESQGLHHAYRYDDGQLQVDRYALYQILLPFIDDGLQVTGVAATMYGVYGMNTVRDALFWNGTSGSGNECFRRYEIDIGDLAQATQTDRYTTFTCERCTEERVYQFVAHWF
ncbi:M56 family metallopeptidase [Eubacteriales bacterium OttesenSCG-928-A19]|nr:M56 family metallopeptidase [Eubacteriales bacterium OttesenSCG-928-A19]